MYHNLPSLLAVIPCSPTRLQSNSFCFFFLTFFFFGLNTIISCHCFGPVFYLRFTVHTTSTRSLAHPHSFVHSSPRVLSLTCCSSLSWSWLQFSLRRLLVKGFFFSFSSSIFLSVSLFKPHLPPSLSRHIFVEGDLFLSAHHCYYRCTYLV